MNSCDEFCITAFNGVDDTQAFESSFIAIKKRGGGKLVLPRGTARTVRPLQVPSRTTVEGQGREVTRIENNTSDIFRLGSSQDPQLENVGFRDMTVISRTGGHLFLLDGRADRCSWRSLYLVQFNTARQIFRRVTASTEGGFFDCLWEQLLMQLSPDLDAPTTVPAFEVSAPSQQFNSNTLRNLKCLSSNDQPFFRFTCNAQQRNNNCVMSQINFAACYGGMVHWYSAGNWTCESLVQFDLDSDIPTRNDGFYLGRGPSGPGPACRHMTFIGCDREVPAF